ncbi:flagellar biosynthesis protein FlhB [Roseomonas sp. CCTCC AB2023176]|uniref:EscU/YscU/HrcU family type III secretion system export apparatus switch protein n=1 Tax=Roseomonas sp. CCTCC AB2023176 TaxID=3342640 RepID=UPI0035DC6037
MAGDADQDQEDRTEAPTQRRLDKAREDGQVPLARGLRFRRPPPGKPRPGSRRFGLGTHAAGPTRPPRRCPRPFARGRLVGPRPGLALGLAVAAAAALGFAAATLAQTRGLISSKGLMPRLSRLSPAAGLKRLFGPDGLLEFLKTLLKIAAVGAAVWPVLSGTERLSTVAQLDAAGLLRFVGDRASALLAATLAAFAGIAALDLLWVRFRHLRQLRMSRQEMKEELRDTDGDPQLKGRLAALRRSRAKSRMMAAVPRAAVVITNPTHYAVALAYEDGAAAAPRIVAKGADEVAGRIREAARDAGVPLVSNPPLARALFRLELGTEIPPDHYQAVAEIIAFVWRRRPAGSP